MKSDHEQSLIALKPFLHNLGFDKNDPQRTIDQKEAVQILQCRKSTRICSNFRDAL